MKVDVCCGRFLWWEIYVVQGLLLLLLLSAEEIERNPPAGEGWKKGSGNRRLAWSGSAIKELSRESAEYGNGNMDSRVLLRSNPSMSTFVRVKVPMKKRE